MRDSLIQWACAGDPSVQLKLAEIFLEEGNVDEAKKFLEQAAEKNYRHAARKLAKIFEDENNLRQAVKFYKQAAELNDLKAAKKLVKLCPDNEEILDFVLEIIDSEYNGIYFTEDIMGQMMTFESSRLSEFLPGQAKAIERCKLKNKILKLKAAM